MPERSRDGEPRDRVNSAREAAKDVICDILAAASGRMRGKVRLNKAFYFAHLYYWRAEETVLTGYPIVALENGPAIDNLDTLLTELVSEGRIKVQRGFNGPYPEFDFQLLQRAEIDPVSARHRAIADAVMFVQKHTAAYLLALTHEHSRSWRATPKGSEMHIYTDLFDDDEIRKIRAAREETRALMSGIAGTR